MIPGCSLEPSLEHRKRLAVELAAPSPLRPGQLVHNAGVPAEKGTVFPDALELKHSRTCAYLANARLLQCPTAATTCELLRNRVAGTADSSGVHNHHAKPSSKS